GEILRELVPRIPHVLVNLNHDDRNPEIFRPFQDTVDHLAGIEPFEIKSSPSKPAPTHGALADLRANLFNPALPARMPTDDRAEQAAEIRYLECGDRDTEIRAIVKEIKELVLREGYNLADIVLVVRQRAAYSETIARVLREESLPCNLESRVEVNDIPALRAALKLFAVLEQLTSDQPANPRISELADLIKSEYFRLGQNELDALTKRFEAEGLHLVTGEAASAGELREKLRNQYRIGVWD